MNKIFKIIQNRVNNNMLIKNKAKNKVKSTHSQKLKILNKGNNNLSI